MRHKEKHVYFMDVNPDTLESVDLFPLTKVGVTTDVDRRKSNIQGQCPLEIEVAAKFLSSDYEAVETALHKEFRSNGWHHRREWFQLPDDVIWWAQEQNRVDSVGEVARCPRVRGNEIVRGRHP